MRRLALLAAAAGTVLLVAFPFGLALVTGGAAAGATAGGGCGNPAGTDMAMIGLQVGTRMQASERVLLAAMEAGLVESGMRNLPYGDLDSLGVLQQRPSQGWGTPSQIMDPAYAFGEFYKRAIALDQSGFPGTAGALAQRIQRSAFPDRYELALPDASTLLRHLGPVMPVGCALAAGGKVAPVPPGFGTPGPCGLSPATDYARYLVQQTFGVTNIGGCATAGHVSDSYHYPDANGQAHALDVMVAGDRVLGDRVAAWAVANAGPLNTAQVLYYGRIWQPGTGWHDCQGTTSSCAAKHFDHVHLSIDRGA